MKNAPAFTAGEPPAWDVERFLHGDEVDTAAPARSRSTRRMGTASFVPPPHARPYQLFGPSSRVDVTDQVPVDYLNLS